MGSILAGNFTLIYVHANGQHTHRGDDHRIDVVFGKYFEAINIKQGDRSMQLGRTGDKCHRRDE